MTGAAAHKVVVRRATSLYKDAELHRILIEYLRSARNELAHTGATFDSHYEDEIVGDLTQVVHQLIRYHIFLRGKWSFDEACAILNVPRNPKLLRKAASFFAS